MRSTQLSARSRTVAIFGLLILAPIIVEFLFGSTRISTFYLLLPQLGVYGCGALLIRALARRGRRGWVAILLLGLAFAIVLECLTLQTALAPLFIAADPHHIYGRALGINWLYLLFQLGYESMWAIVLPIQLAEALFPDRRDDPWLETWGLIVAAVVFVLASAATWFLWGQAVHKFVKGSGYQAPPLTIIAALAVVAALCICALGPWVSVSPGPKSVRSAPRPWLVRLAAFWLALLWFVLAVFSVGVAPAVPPVIPIACGLALAAIALVLVRRWSARSNWQDTHRLALVSGALYASMLAGFLVSGATQPVDLIGKLALNVMAVVGLVMLSRRIQRRQAALDDAYTCVTPSAMTNRGTDVSV